MSGNKKIEEKKIEEGGQKLDYAKKAMDLAKIRSRRLIANLLIITIVVTVVGVSMTSVNMGRVFAFMLVAMLPGLVTSILDRRPGRFAAKTVTAFNISGLSPHLAAIIASGSPDSTASSIFQNPEVWLLIYGFAAFGWGVVYLIPHIAKLYYEIKASFTIKKLSFFQEKLVEEWGDEVK